MNDTNERLAKLEDELNAAVELLDRTRKGSKRHRQRHNAVVTIIVQAAALSVVMRDNAFNLLAWIDGDGTKTPALLDAGILKNPHLQS